MAVLVDQKAEVEQLDQPGGVQKPWAEAAISTARTPGESGAGRLIGIDLARAFALIGMFTQHVYLSGEDGSSSSGWVAWFFEQSAGRASVLFFILSGISLSMIHRRGSASASPGALYRRGFLLLTGGILLTISIWPASILQHYGVAFLLAPLLLRMGWRGLTAMTGAGLIGGPIVLLFARNWSDEVAGIWDGRSGAWLIENGWDILVSGIYPMVLWIGFFTFGMLLGRLGLRDRRTMVRLLTASIIATLALGSMANLLVDRYGDVSFKSEVTSGENGGETKADDVLADDSLWKEKADGSFMFIGDERKLGGFTGESEGTFDGPAFEEQPADWRALYDVTGHSGRIGWTLQTSAIAVAILSFCLLLPAAAKKLLSPLAWMGSMSLTAYLVHIVLVNDVFEPFIAEAGWSILTKELAFLGLVLTLIVSCSFFYRLWTVGPLEWLLKQFTVREQPNQPAA